MPAGYRSLEPNLSCCPAGFECLGTREIFGVVSAAALMNLCFRRAVGETGGLVTGEPSPSVRLSPWMGPCPWEAEVKVTAERETEARAV